MSWLTDGGPLALGVIVIPIVAFAMWASERKQKEVAKEAKNAEDFGTGFKYSHLAGPSGIAIDPDRKMLRLRAGADTRLSVRDRAASVGALARGRVCSRCGA